jgi:hypothetical protein
VSRGSNVPSESFTSLREMRCKEAIPRSCQQLWEERKLASLGILIVWLD